MSKFFFRTHKTEGEATLFVQVMRRSPKVKFVFCTQIVVDIEKWCNANKNIDTWNRFHNGEGKKVCEILDNVNKTIDNLLACGVTDKSIIIDAVMGVVYKEQRELQAEQERIKNIEREKQRNNIVSFYDYFMQGITNGSIQHKGKRYTDGSLHVWRTFGGILRPYYEKHPFTFDSIDKRTADEFNLYMTDEIGLMPKTCNKYSICMRRLCNYAAEIGVNRNATSLKVWCERTIHEQDKQKEIYLTDAEIDAMYNMKLKGLFSQVRDAFVIGALTAQRFSDYIRLSSSDITTTERGNRVIVMVQQKTGNKVVIPILDERIVEILQRYEEPLFVIRDTKETQCKAITEQVFNRTIKKVCELLSASIPSLNKEEVTQMTAREKQIEARTGKSLYKRDAHGNVLTPRWRLVTSHTARRSGVTNIYKTGLLDTQEMMSISGHKSERVFEGYIKLSDIEQADKIAGKFKRK